METNIFNRQKSLFGPCFCLFILIQIFSTSCNTTKTVFTDPEQKWIVIAETLPGIDITQLPRIPLQYTQFANIDKQVSTVVYRVPNMVEALHLKNELTSTGLVTQIRAEQYDQQITLNK